MHYFKANLEEIDFYRFLLPVHFVGLEGSDVLQLTVEYGSSFSEKNSVTANVWCGYQGATIRAYLMSATIPESDNQALAIVQYLQESEDFYEAAHKFVGHFGKYR